jgi:hypothetical protein
MLAQRNEYRNLAQSRRDAEFGMNAFYVHHSQRDQFYTRLQINTLLEKNLCASASLRED